MSLRIKPYFAGAYLALREKSVFTLEFAMTLFMIVFQTALYWAVFHQILTPQSALSSQELVQYYVIINLVTLSILPAQFVAYEHMQEINTGRMVLEILKPFSPAWNWFWQKLAEMGLRLLIHMVLILVFQVLVMRTFALGDLLCGMVSTVLGFVILYLLQGLVGALSIWFADITRMRDFLIYDFAMILGGQLFPSSHLAAGLKRVVYWTPFPYIYDVPTTCFQGVGMGRMVGQGLWIVGLGVAYLLLMRFAVMRNVEYGT